MLVNVLGTNIFYEVVGEGLPVVFFHGLGSTSNVWHAQRLGLSKFFRIITVDLPGSGRSDKHERDYSMDRWTEQVLGFADALKLDKFVLVGHSMTTVLAQQFAGTHPDRLQGLVLCGPLVELGAEAKENFNKRAEGVQKEGMIAVADAVVGGALSAATREANPALTGMVREMLLSNDTACYAGHCLALRDGSAKPFQAKITCPTLILVGDQDFVTPLANCQEITQAVSDAHIKVIPATAHNTMMERPEYFNATMIEFLMNL
ncbi:MAG: alpha/beta fold hydrolase [Gemmataceae bacterium]